MKFQTILLSVFGVMAVVGLIVFSAMPAKKSSPIGAAATEFSGASGNVQIWGTFQKNQKLEALIQSFNKKYADYFSISYTYHDPKNFDNDIVEALASKRGPDVLLLPDDLILRHSDKIKMIPYVSFPQASFYSTFIQAAEIYIRDDGLVALPFAVDPMVMYWNRDIFNNASITQPPKLWDEFLVQVPKLTKRDVRTYDISQSALSFGEYVNVTHAKDIIAMLFLQVGNPIVKIDGGRPISAISKFSDNGSYVPEQNIISALRYFMDFSNPLKTIYTWNRARQMSREEFITGNLAVYFDYASSYDLIKAQNPHLNFGVARVPQPRDTSAEVTFAKVHGLAVLNEAPNQATALIAVKRLLLDVEPSRDFADAFNLPPVRRDLLKVTPTDAAMTVFYDGAIRARTWLDPKPEESDKSFRVMVESISSGLSDPTKAVSRLSTDISELLSHY